MLAIICLPMQRNLGIWKILGPKVALHYSFLGIWVVLMQEEYLGLACVCAGLALLLVIVPYMALEVGTRRTELLQMSERIIVHIPLSASMAWTSFMLILSISVYYKMDDWYSFGFQYEMALFMVVLMDLIAFGMLKTRRDWGTLPCRSGHHLSLLPFLCTHCCLHVRNTHTHTHARCNKETAVALLNHAY